MLHIYAPHYDIKVYVLILVREDNLPAFPSQPRARFLVSHSIQSRIQRFSMGPRLPAFCLLTIAQNVGELDSSSKERRRGVLAPPPSSVCAHYLAHIQAYVSDLIAVCLAFVEIFLS